MGKTEHFKFDVHIDVDEYSCMHDRLLPKGWVQCRVTYKFRKITDNISEMVHSRDIVTMEA